jgi:phosphoribosylanthranilate isomerase
VLGDRMQPRTWIKICGVTSPADIELVHEAGADAVGLNFISRSKRRVDIPTARWLSAVARGKLEVVGVVADCDESKIRELVEVVGLDRVQLHGDEPDELLERLGPIAYKAVGVSSAADVEIAQGVFGERVLVDARVDGVVGGTGSPFAWSLVENLCRRRAVIVAGGLNPDNVAGAVTQLCPFGIDAASGVELPGRPGQKDRDLVRRLVEEIRHAEVW